MDHSYENTVAYQTVQSNFNWRIKQSLEKHKMTLLKTKTIIILSVIAIITFPNLSQAYENKKTHYANEMTKLIVREMCLKYNLTLNTSGHSNSKAIEGFKFSFNSQSYLDLDQARQFILQVRSDIEWIVNKNTGLPKIYCWIQVSSASTSWLRRF